MTEQVQAADDQFPTLVYKGHGSHSRAGGTYDYTDVTNQEDLEAKLADGWFITLPEAIDAHDKPVVAKSDETVVAKSDETVVAKSDETVVAKSDETAPPTRKELETKAKELNIKFDKKTTDAELGAAITAALTKE